MLHKSRLIVAFFVVFKNPLLAVELQPIVNVSGCSQTDPVFNSHYSEQGLGNRILALASGYAEARFKKTCNVIKWDENRHLKTKFEDLFSNPILEIVGEELLIRNKAHASKNLTLYNALPEKYQNSEEVTFTKLYNIKRTQGLSKAGHLTYIKSFVDRLSPSAIVRKKLESVQSLHQKDSYLAIHIRTLSDAIEPKKRDYLHMPFGERDIKNLVMAIEEAENRLNVQNMKLFVLTDDKKTTEMLIKFFQKNSRQAFTVDAELSRGKKGSRDATILWFLMGDAYAVIGSLGSSFSDTAALRTTSGRKFSYGNPHPYYHNVKLKFKESGCPFLDFRKKSKTKSSG